MLYSMDTYHVAFEFLYAIFIEFLTELGLLHLFCLIRERHVRRHLITNKVISVGVDFSVVGEIVSRCDLGFHE